MESDWIANAPDTLDEALRMEIKEILNLDNHPSML
jgi:hypothetical protein